MSDINLRTLVLNADYSPISIIPLHHIPVKDAITRVVNGTATVVETYDRVIKTPNPIYRTAFPSVIVRTEFLNREIVLGPHKRNLFYRDMCKCGYCGRRLILSSSNIIKEDSMTIDHVVPRAKGGKHEWTNIVAACPKCNSEKGDKMPTGSFAPKVKVYEPTYFQLLNCRKHFPLNIHHESWAGYLGTWPGGLHIIDKIELDTELEKD